jgi:excisionase family DNA binding protein
MRSTTATQPSVKRESSLRGACEKSARSLIPVIRRATPGKSSPEALTDLVDSLTGVIERTAELLLAGKYVRVIEDDETMTTQEAADLLNVSRPYLVKLLETGQIPQLPKVGRHRRVARVVVLKYKRTRDALRESALKKLAALSQRHRLGY